MSNSWVPSRHQYRMNQQAKRSRWQVCDIHNVKYEAYGLTSVGLKGPKRCPSCCAEDRWWAQAEQELGHPANLDKRAVYQRAAAISGLSLYRYLRYAH